MNGSANESHAIPIHNNHRAPTTQPNGTGGNVNGISRVLILGSNRLSNSIIDSLREAKLDLHQAVQRHSHHTSESGLRVHKTDFSSQSLHDLFSTVKPDLLISTASGGSYETQKRIVDTAIATQIPRFVPAEFGHDSLNPKIQERLPHHRERARIIADLKAQSDLSWLAIATGTPLDQGLHSGNLGYDFKWQSATLHGSGNESFPASSSTWIGRVVLAAIERFDEMKNSYIYACSLTTSANAILASLEKVTGRDWAAGAGYVDECIREAERRIERGFPDGGMFLMERSVMYDESLGALKPFVESDAKEVLGLEGETLEDVVRMAEHQHRHHGKGGCGCD